MPAGYKPMEIEAFGGLNTLIEPSNLPPFMSPDCADVAFLPGLVQTRPGTFQAVFGAPSPTTNVNYLKTYITEDQDVLALFLISSGQLWKNIDGVVGETFIANIEDLASFGNSTTLFGREFIALGNGEFGQSLPRAYNNTNLDRVSQEGPGAAPSVIDENPPSVTIVASAGGLIPFTRTVSSLTQSGNTVFAHTSSALPTQLQVDDYVHISGAGVGGYNGDYQVSAITGPNDFQYVVPVTGLSASSGSAEFGIFQVNTATAHDLTAGGFATISGATNTSYNGTWTIRSVDTATQATLVGGVTQASLPASGGGTIVAAGNIVAGKHLVSVLFVTRNGYLTRPAPFGSWIAAGGKRALVGNIPIGPLDVTQRILLFTAVNAESFFFTTGTSLIPNSNMVIGDNTTQSAIVDFSDASLLSGTNVDDLFDLVTLGEANGVTSYTDRLFWTGELNKIQNFVNLSFAGGSSNNLGTVPLGWTANPTGFLGSVGGSPVMGNIYRISGDSATAVAGLITQSAYQDVFGAPILQPAIGYSVRVRLQNAAPSHTTGTFHIHLQSTSLLIDSGLDIPLASVVDDGIRPTLYTGVLTAGITQIPSDLLLKVYMDGTPVTGTHLDISNIEIFPTNQPYNTTVVRASRVPDEAGLYSAESYNGVDGFLDVAPANGQPVRCSFVLRDFLYFAKDRSLYVTADDPNSEPANWAIHEVSAKVGTLSARGVGLGDEWAVIAGETGAWLFTGGPLSDENNLSKEIQPTWDQINWNLGYLIDVKVDTKRKRIYIAVPMGATATQNNRVLTLDYTDGFGDPVANGGTGRKWAPWFISCNSMNLILQSNVQQFMFGNNSMNGAIQQIDTTGTIFTDLGQKIPDYWQSGYFQSITRQNFGIATTNTNGSGSLQISLRKGNQQWFTPLRPWNLKSQGFYDLERNFPSNLETPRLAVRFATLGTGDHFSMQGLTLWARESAYAATRGVNF